MYPRVTYRRCSNGVNSAAEDAPTPPRAAPPADTPTPPADAPTPPPPNPLLVVDIILFLKSPPKVNFMLHKTGEDFDLIN